MENTPLANLLKRRTLCLALVCGSLIYGLLSLAGLTLFPCPLKSCTGLPCPGCGLTRSVIALSQGDWQASLQYNALTLPYLLIFALLTLSLVLPVHPRQQLTRWVAKSETRTRWSTLFAFVVLAYFLTRLIPVD